jgi:hypothetical protein
MTTNSIAIKFIDQNLDLFLMEKELKDFFISCGMRGVMAIMGFRKTTGS